MKQLLITAIAATVLLSACDNGKQQEKAALTDVLSMHDKVMADEGALMSNKMQLDTLLKTGLATVKDTTGKKAAIETLIKKLNVADDQMENWMQKFEPDQSKKPHEEVMAYFKAQKKQIVAVDSSLKAAVDESGTFLKNNKTK